MLTLPASIALSAALYWLRTGCLIRAGGDARRSDTRLDPSIFNSTQDATDGYQFFDPNRTANASAWRVLPNRWDVVAFPLIIGILAMAIVGFTRRWRRSACCRRRRSRSIRRTCPSTRCAPRCGCCRDGRLARSRSTARSPRKAGVGMVLIPILDILQSVPVLGYISFTVTFFLALFPGRVLGAELRDLRDLHEPGVEHDVQLLPVAAHGAT